MHLLEIAGRVVIVYVACMILLRLTGRRELSQLGPMDLLTMLLLSETVSPAITGGDNSMVTGLVAAVTLMGLGVITAQLVYRSRRVEKLVEGAAVVLIRDGKVDADVLRRFMMTNENLEEALHKNGLLSVDGVRRAYVEPGGEVTMIKADKT